jgi:uncharacterized short protein YbdD (DUF466 family)
MPEGTGGRADRQAPDRMTAGGYVLRNGLWSRVGVQIRTCLSTFRRVVGMPDYAGYLHHLQQRHPDWPVPTEREFFRMYVESRYGNGATRCC